jgi:hypothetical protein
MELDYDSDGLPCPGKPAQKRQRRRVVVEARDPSGRLYTAAEIRRMKRCARPPGRRFPARARRSRRAVCALRRG